MNVEAKKDGVQPKKEVVEPKKEAVQPKKEAYKSDEDANEAKIIKKEEIEKNNKADVEMNEIITNLIWLIDIDKTS